MSNRPGRRLRALQSGPYDPMSVLGPYDLVNTDLAHWWLQDPDVPLDVPIHLHGRHIATVTIGPAGSSYTQHLLVVER